MYLHTVRFNNQNKVRYNLKWGQKRKLKKESKGKDKKSKWQKTLQQPSGNKRDIIAGVQSQDYV